MKPPKRSAQRGLSRREFGQSGLAFLLALGNLHVGRASADGQSLVDDIPANAALLKGVQYVPESVKADQRCANCVLFQPQAAGRGKCALFQQGLVPEQAWCLSWGPKPS